MKKIRFTALVFALASGICLAQAPIKIGETQLNTGLGLVQNQGPSFSIGIDYGLVSNVSIGGNIYFGWYSRDEYNHTVGIETVGNYHFNELLKIKDPRWDVYAGLGLRYSWSLNSYSYFDFNTHVGGRYFFNDKIGLNVEMAPGLIFSYIMAGVTIKL